MGIRPDQTNEPMIACRDTVIDEQLDVYIFLKLLMVADRILIVRLFLEIRSCRVFCPAAKLSNPDEARSTKRLRMREQSFSFEILNFPPPAETVAPNFLQRLQLPQSILYVTLTQNYTTRENTQTYPLSVTRRLLVEDQTFAFSIANPRTLGSRICCYLQSS